MFVYGPKFLGFDDNGDPLSGGLLYTYSPGTTTNKATYPTVADSIAATNALANPVVLDSRGEATVVLAGSYKLVLKTSAGVTLWTVDNYNPLDMILDDNGNEILDLNTVASAVNYAKLSNSATGNAVILEAVGSDTDIDLDLKAKGAGSVNFTGTLSLDALSATGLSVVTEDSRTATVDILGTFTSTTDDTPAAGIGTGLTFKAESADENPSDLAELNFTFTDVTAASEDSKATLKLRYAGNALDDAYSFAKTGAGDINFTHAATVARTVTFPDEAGTVYINAQATTLSDTNSNELIKFTTTASAVNELTVANAATGTGPTLSTTGGDTDIVFNFQAKGTGVYNFLSTASASTELRLFEDTDDGTDYIGLKAPALAASVTFTLPNADGTVGQLLNTDGAGVLAWGDPASITVGGSDTHVQFNDATTLGGDAGFTFNKTTDVATIVGVLVVGGNATAAGYIQLLEDSDNGSNKITITPPASLAADYTLTLPTTDGTADQFLKTNGSGTLSWDGNDMVLISTTTLSSQATAEITGLSSTYFKYIIELNGIDVSADGAALWLRYSDDGGSTYEADASDYAWSRATSLATTSGALNNTGDDADAQIVLVSDQDTTTATSIITGKVEIYNPTSSTLYKICQFNIMYADNSAGLWANSNGGGAFLSTSASTAVQILVSTGTMVSGTIKVYGIRA